MANEIIFVSAYDFAATLYAIELAPTDLDARRPYGLTYAILTARGHLVRKNGKIETFRSLERATKNCKLWNDERPGYRVVIVRELEGEERARAELIAQSAMNSWEKDLGTAVDAHGDWCENAILATQEANEMSL